MVAPVGGHLGWVHRFRFTDFGRGNPPVVAPVGGHLGWVPRFW
ncbi:hypothetical protein [Prochlorothrix hollandica]|nr:hypothetical protein [Prochlorothrix hollandica]